MEQYHLYAYEGLGVWQIAMTRRQVGDDSQPREQLLYRGDHVLIDEQDPLIRAELILHQVLHDIEQANRGNLDILEERATSH